MPSQNLQTHLAQKAAKKLESTHGIAPQASAGQLIQLLRLTYRDIKTQRLTESDAALKNNLSENSQLYEKQRIKTESAVQVSLIDYIAQVIKTLEETALCAINPETSHPNIQASVAMVQCILKLEEYSPQDKIRIFKQMQSIAKTCPGLQWDEHHSQWSTNALYNLSNNRKRRRTEYVIASPAETLNLVCRALLDESRYALTQQKDMHHRILAFCVCCIELQQQVERGQLEKCSTGRQHDLLFLLNGAYLDKQNTESDAQPVQLLIDTESFLIERVAHFVEESIQQLPEEKQFQLSRDWMLYQNDLSEHKVPPVISLLRNRFSVTSNLEEKTEVELDLRWKDALMYFLAKQCQSHGLNPKECKLNDHLSSIETLACPILTSTTLPLLQSILDTLPIAEEKSSKINSLILLRNEALGVFRAEIKQQTQHPAKAIQKFYVALQIVDKLHHYRNLTVFIGADEALFDQSYQQLQHLLMDYFNGYSLNHSKSNEFYQQFETLSSIFFNQEKQFRQKSHADVIENFFTRIKDNPQHFKEAFERVCVMLSDNKSECPIFVSEDMLEKWHRHNVSSDQTAIALSSYEINRILLHALTTSLLEWSPNFCAALSLLTSQLQPSAQDSYAFANLKQSYSSVFLKNLDFLIAIKHSNDIPEATKIQYDKVLSGQEHAIVDEPLFIYLCREHAELSAEQRIHMLSLIDTQQIDVNQRLTQGTTALYVAAERGDVLLVEALLQKGADRELMHNNEWTPLLVAAEHGHIAVIRSLIQNIDDVIHLLQSELIPDAQIRIIFNSKIIREYLPIYINDGRIFIDVLKKVPPNKISTFYESMETHMPRFIKSQGEFLFVLNHLKYKSQSKLIKTLRIQLEQFITNFTAFRWTLNEIKLLKTLFCETIKNKLPEFVSNTKDLVMMILYLTPRQVSGLCEDLGSRLSQLIVCIEDLEFVLFSLYEYPERKKAFYESIKPILPQIIKNSGGDISPIIDILSPKQMKEISHISMTLLNQHIYGFFSTIRADVSPSSLENKVLEVPDKVKDLIVDYAMN